MSSERQNYRIFGNVGIGVGAMLILLAILILFINFKINVSRDWLGNVTGVSYEFPNVPYSFG